MKIQIFSIWLVGLALHLSCSKETGHKSDPVHDSSQANAVDGQGAWNADIESQGPVITDLPLLSSGGSAMSFLDSIALTKIYSRVFPQSSYGYKHCEFFKPADYKACDNMFSPDEIGTLGTFSLYNPALNRGIQNVNLVTSVSLNYMRSLRSGLSRECNSLVIRELANLANGLGKNNILIKDENPSAETIQGFLITILGLQNAGIQDLNFDSKGYAADFPKAVAILPDQTKARQNAYLNLCIAVAMDPQVFLY